jgi:YfiH family protein
MRCSEGRLEFSSLGSSPGVRAGVTLRGSEDDLTRALPGVRALAFAKQVHGTGVAVAEAAPGSRDDAAEADAVAGGVAAPDAIGNGPARWSFPPADALVTSRPGVALLVSVADCLPILLVEDEGRAVAAVHAGWRGLVAGVIGSALDALARRYGIRARDCRALLGPAIGTCCYRVREDVVAAFARAGREGMFVRRGDSLYLDLVRTARRQLGERGVPDQRTESSDLCTACNPDRFYSRRRDGKILGRMYGFVMLDPDGKAG